MIRYALLQGTEVAAIAFVKERWSLMPAKMQSNYFMGGHEGQVEDNISGLCGMKF